MEFVATITKGIEDLLVTELASMDIEAKPMKAGVRFQGDLETAYRVCLWSRLANRVFLPIATADVEDEDALYKSAKQIDWSKHLQIDTTFKVSATVARSNINHSRYAALKTKDAIVDQFRERFEQRPSVATDQPDVSVNVFIDRNRVEFAIDLSGESLHHRGYRSLGGVATLKENLAAALLYRTGWPTLMKQGHAFVDFMCGSGTLPIEAAMMACDIAPGLFRQRFGFNGWRGHNDAIWQRVLAEAHYRREQGLLNAPVIQGFDHHKPTLEKAQQHVENAGLGEVVQIAFQDVKNFKLDFPQHGLVLVNAPYGKRVGDQEDLVELYQAIGEVLKQRFLGWRAGVFTDDLDHGKALGVRAKKIHSLYNGNIECKLLTIEVSEQTVMRDYRLPRLVPVLELSDAANGLRNRLRKNQKKLGKWLKQEEVSCYRIYDADLPDYAAAIDLYQTQEHLVAHVQEYEAPKSIDEAKAKRRLSELLSVVQDEFELPVEHIHLKQRKRQKGSAQYEKQSTSAKAEPERKSSQPHADQYGLGDINDFSIVSEGGCRFYVHFEKYLDTGLFLDHRPLRMMVQQQAQGKTLLNLFAYTGAFSVHAAKAGAKTTTLDMSNTYLEWTRRNFELNNIDTNDHIIQREDCVAWLQQPVTERYDIIVLDPPSFSNSKKMDDVFDVQRDHVALVEQSVKRLAPDGVLYFSNNRRGFKLDEQLLDQYQITDITHFTVPPDFKQRKHVHQCWKVEAR